MLDMQTAHQDRALVAIKVSSLLLGLLVASMFFLPVIYYTHPFMLFWRWSLYLSHESPYFDIYFGENVELATAATILEYVPDLISVVLSIAAIGTMARSRQKGAPQSAWKSNVVLGAFCFNAALTGWRCYSVVSGFLNNIIINIYFSDPATYILPVVLCSQDEIVMFFLALYLVLFAWKCYRYP